MGGDKVVRLNTAARLLNTFRKYSPASDRETLGFFICGLFNNYAYVIMLAAAKSLLPETSYASTVLLADDLPALLAQFMSPFLLGAIPYRVRVTGIVIATMVSLISAAVASEHPAVSTVTALCAVAITSLCFGFGESTFFSLLSFHGTKAIGAFSSGTGCAGILGSGLYYGLINIVSPPTALFILALLVPLHAFSFAYLIMPAHADRKASQMKKHKHRMSSLSDPEAGQQSQSSSGSSTSSQCHILLANWRTALHYFVPLWVLYVVTYTINHALLTHAYDQTPVMGSAHLGTDERSYVSLFLTYQIAVFCSRSSLKLVQLKSMISVWALVALQVAIFGLILTHVLDWAPVWVSHGIGLALRPLVLVEGLVSGAVYVNTFALLRQNVDARIREILMGLVVCATTAGPIMAAMIGMAIEHQVMSAPSPGPES